METALAHNQSPEPGTDFPAGLAKPAQRALAGAGYVRLVQLTTVDEDELLKLHGMGPQAVALLLRALEAAGLSFAATARGRA